MTATKSSESTASATSTAEPAKPPAATNNPKVPAVNLNQAANLTTANPLPATNCVRGSPKGSPRTQDPTTTATARKKSAEKKPKYATAGGSGGVEPATAGGPVPMDCDEGEEGEQEEGEGEDPCWIAEEEVCPWEDE